MEKPLYEIQEKFIKQKEVKKLILKSKRVPLPNNRFFYVSVYVLEHRPPQYPAKICLSLKLGSESFRLYEDKGLDILEALFCVLDFYSLNAREVESVFEAAKKGETIDQTENIDFESFFRARDLQSLSAEIPAVKIEDKNPSVTQ